MNIIITIFAVGVLIALHELGHMVVARKMGMQVLRYSVGFFKPIFSWRSEKTGIVYQVGALPLGGFVQIGGMNPFEKGATTDPKSYLNQPIWRRAMVLVAGPLSNLLLAWLVLFVLFSSSGNPEPLNESRVGRLVDGGPAEQAGLKTGDEIRSVNGEPVKTWEDLLARIEPLPAKEVSLEVVRDGSGFLVTLTTYDSEGKGKLGIYPPEKIVTLPVHQAALGAALKCVQVSMDTLGAIGGLFTGEGGVKAAGPLKIVQILAMDLDVGLTAFFSRFAFLSLMLFLFNLLPFPALDGGRAAFLLYEAVSRRRVPPRVDVIVNTVGFVLLIGLLLFMSVHDVLEW